MNSSVRVRYGEAEFSAEGTPEWVASQFDKFLGHLDKQDVPKPKRQKDEPAVEEDDISRKALGAFLRELNAQENQARKFLATAVWLHAKGAARLKTGAIAAALRESNQSRLGNASQCLANNVTQGFIEREGDKFFVTDEGRDSLK